MDQHNDNDDINDELSNMNITNCNKEKKRVDICLNCLKEVDGLLTCERCRTARYCGRACQLLHWSVHKTNCIDSNKDNSDSKLDTKAANHFKQGNRIYYTLMYYHY